MTEEFEDLPLPVRLDPSGAVLVPSVVDADAILASVNNQCRTGWQSRISRLGEGRHSPVFASTHVYGEAYKGFAKLETEHDVITEMRACFEADYLPHISWVRVAEGHGHDARVRMVTDATDVPTAHLASLIAPCLVFADDKSLRRPGFAPQRWRDAAGLAVTVSASRDGQESLVLTAGLPSVGALNGAAALSRRLELRGWIGPLAVMGGLAWLLARTARRSVVGRVLQPLMDEAIRLKTNQRRAQAQPAVILFQPVEEQTPKQMIAAVLARASGPILAKEILAVIEEQYPSSPAPTVTTVRAILAEEPEFRQPLRYRWQLGYRAAPIADDAFARIGQTRD